MIELVNSRKKFVECELDQVSMFLESGYRFLKDSDKIEYEELNNKKTKKKEAKSGFSS